jgi:N-glycosylase/DNA lyase
MNIDSAHRDELLATYTAYATEIRSTLAAFRAVPAARHFYELCFCMMTPQSSALQCAAVAEELERRGFHECAFDPSGLLRSHDGGYVRFHNTKARRLLRLREDWPVVRELLADDQDDKALRDALAETVQGIGMKEASHFVRNIGRTRVTIVDRHILRNLVRLGALDEWPKSIGRRMYLDIERRFECVAHTLGIPPDELDLLLWRRETGFILK